MEQLLGGILISFILYLFVHINFLILRRFYYYYKGYSKEISEFLIANNLTLIEVITPKSEDWKINPFKTKDSNIIDLVFSFSIKKHCFFIIEDENEEIKEYWIRNHAPLFGKVKTEFQIATIKRLKNGTVKYQINEIINFPNGICPACREKIENSVKECPNCGLVFE